MKKFIFALLLGLAGLAASAQSYWFESENLSIRYSGRWSDWEPCNVKIKVDLDYGKVTIYSDQTQIYRIIRETRAPYDPTGTQSAFRVKDQDGDYGTMRIRKQDNGILQLYIDFGDIGWVYDMYHL